MNQLIIYEDNLDVRPQAFKKYCSKREHIFYLIFFLFLTNIRNKHVITILMTTQDSRSRILPNVYLVWLDECNDECRKSIVYVRQVIDTVHTY